MLDKSIGAENWKAASLKGSIVSEIVIVSKGRSLNISSISKSLISFKPLFEIATVTNSSSPRPDDVTGFVIPSTPKSKSPTISAQKETQGRACFMAN